MPRQPHQDGAVCKMETGCCSGGTSVALSSCMRLVFMHAFCMHSLSMQARQCMPGKLWYDAGCNRNGAAQDSQLPSSYSSSFSSTSAIAWRTAP